MDAKNWDAGLTGILFSFEPTKRGRAWSAFKFFGDPTVFALENVTKTSYFCNPNVIFSLLICNKFMVL